MADTKITGFGALTTPDKDDPIAVVDDPGGTPVTKKITLQYFLEVLDGLTALGDRPVVADEFLVYDASASAGSRAKKVTWRNLFVRYAELVAFDFTTNTATGDGKYYFHIPKGLDGLDLVEVHAEVITAGTTNVISVQIHNITKTQDMLSTLITIDTGETGSDTAATPAVINTSQDDISENDMLRVDVDAIHTTPAKGLIITLGFA